MAQTTYNVIVTGKILDNFNPDQVVQAATKLFKCSEEKVRAMFSGKAFPLKKQIDKSTAEKYVQQLLKVGIGSRVDEVREAAQESWLSLEPKADAPPESTPHAAPTPQAVAQGKVAAKPALSAHGSGAEPVVDRSKFQTAAQPEEDEVSDEFDDLMDYVRDNVDFYRAGFRDIYDNDGKYKPQWHWGACIVTMPWLLHRKLYALVPFYLVSTIALGLLPFPRLLSLVLVFVLPGLFGNYIYYLFARKRILTVSGQDMARRSELERRGGTNSMATTIGLSIGVLFVIGMLQLAFMASFVKSKDIGSALDQMRETQKTMEQLTDDNEKATMASMMMLKAMYGLRVATASGHAPQTDNIADLTKFLGLEEDAIKDAWGNVMALQVEGDALLLHSAGIDAAFDTKDDLTYKISK